ncbi:hypothetical protein DKX38_017946 [Salix brachista]|uniref:Biogenesis of lysosome-related organelles complex 1 subunit 7 n=1 Tax=Salix brachista TaxID=2182728 RepID=A0A5N5KWT6_9ROSI|nr:hypothetical protein DKX38_017946 [Salix brachista]
MDPSVSTGENTGSNENNSQESESESNNNPSDALGKALSTMLANVIKDFDSKAQDTLNSQDKLNSAIDRLTRELDQLLEDAPLPFIMQHAAKISGVRKRVSSLNSVLKSIQHRVDNIDRLLSVGMLQVEYNLQGRQLWTAHRNTSASLEGSGNRYSNLKLLSAEDFTGIALHILCGADMQFKTSSLPAFILDQKALYGN